MIAIGVGVRKNNNRIPGVVINSAVPMLPWITQNWYQVQWVDGNVSECAEIELDILMPPAKAMVELL